MDEKHMVLLVIGVIAVALTLLALGYSLGIEYNEMAQGVASVSVALALFGVVLFALLDSTAPQGTCVIFGGFAGIILAFIEKALYDQGIMMDSFLGTMSGATIVDLMIITVVLWIIIGLFFEVVRKK